eukprot:2384675-Lingulodinium_polyedra.AAC.1
MQARDLVQETGKKRVLPLNMPGRAGETRSVCHVRPNGDHNGAPLDQMLRANLAGPAQRAHF